MFVIMSLFLLGIRVSASLSAQSIGERHTARRGRNSPPHWRSLADLGIQSALDSLENLKHLEKADNLKLTIYKTSLDKDHSCCDHSRTEKKGRSRYN